MVVYSRVTSEHKMKIIQALKAKGQVVAMTGDGINDATSLKSADIGIAMGITGTQVTKEASSIILTDDNFASIVSAVRQGRRIMDNVRKYLVYLLPVNFGEIIFMGFAIVVGWPIPLLAKQILFINLVTDGPPAIALGLEPAEPDVMMRKPIKPNQSIFKGTLKLFVGISLILAAISIFLFLYVLEENNWSEYGVNKARTVVFVFIVLEEILLALSCRSLNLPFHKIGLLKNKFLLYSIVGEIILLVVILNTQFTLDLFELVYLDTYEWLMILAFAPATFAYLEITKFLKTIKK